LVAAFEVQGCVDEHAVFGRELVLRFYRPDDDIIKLVPEAVAFFFCQGVKIVQQLFGRNLVVIVSWGAATVATCCGVSFSC
jgi:hypothetical protein